MDRSPLTQIVGGVGREPITKSTSKGDVVEFSVAQSDGFGDDAKTTWYDVSVWNEGLQAAILDSKNGIRKGSVVAINGVVKPQGQYNPKISAVQIGIVTFFDRSKAAPQQSSDDDF